MVNDVCKVKIDTSLQYAAKSIELNPTWLKGYHRMVEALYVLGDKNTAENTRIEGDNIRKMNNKLQYEIKREGAQNVAAQNVVGVVIAQTKKRK